MSTKRWPQGGKSYLQYAVRLILVLAAAPMSFAQLSSPINPSSKTASTTKASTATSSSTTSTASTNPMGVPQGQGAGVHSSNSPFAPLPKRDDVVPWSVLTAVTTRTEKNKLLPVFGVQQSALHQKNQRIQGFMMPLEPGEKQRHFLLTSVPLTCSFCLPGGPESMVDVRTKEPVKYSMEPVTVEGRFMVLNDDPYGLYYRISDAVAVK